MKKFIATSLLIVAISFYSQAQWVSIPDTNFGKWLNTNGYLSCLQGNSQVGWEMDTTCPAVMNATIIICQAMNIHDLTGIQYFDNLDSLYCAGNLLSSLSALPNNLIHLECWSNQLNSLSNLPNSMIYLDCYNNQLVSLPVLPNSLRRLNCSNNPLGSLPSLPSSITIMSCMYDSLTSLPVLPSSLINFSCANNQISNLPTLPGGLTNLGCSNNLISSLPVLPASLAILSCNGNQLSSLPSLPGSLTNLSCGSNQLTSLPTLPNNLIYLDCTNSQLNSLPELPDSLYYCRIQNNPITCLPQLKRIVNLEFSNTLLTCLPNYGNVTNSTPPLNSLPLCQPGNVNGCAVALTADVGNDTTICYGGTIALGGNPTASGGTAPYTYSWSPSTIISCNNCANPVATNVLSNITYIVTITDNLGATATATVSISVRPNPIANAGPDQTIYGCSADSVILGGSPTATGTVGPYTYLWRPNFQLSIRDSTSSNPILNNLGVTTNFTVIVTDSFGCSNSDIVLITSSPNTVFAEAGNNTTICSGTSITLGGTPTASGGVPGYTYDWSPAGGLSNPNIPNPVANPTVTTTYTLIATDSRGCQASDTIKVVVNPTPVVSITTTNISCFGGNNGSVCTNVSGGTPPYLYYWWIPNDTTQCLNALSTGNYMVTVVDASACTATAQATVTEPPLLTSQIISATGGILPDTLTVQWTGGNPPYTYLWDNGTVYPSSYIVNQSGTYSVTVWDSNACTASDSISVGSTSITVTYPNGGETFQTGQNINVTWTSTGNIPKVKIEFYSSIAFTWITLADSVANSGSYLFTIPQVPNMQGRIRVSDPYNATVNDQSNGLFNIINCPGTLTAQFVSATGGVLPDTVTCSIQGGTPPYIIDWGCGPITIGLDTAVRVYNCIAGTYYPIVIDSNGCQVLDTLVLTNCVSQCVWPGDADFNGLADNNDLLAIGLGYGTTGTPRTDQTIGWYAHTSTDWLDTLSSGTNYKHIDCNGDSTINADDTLAIIQNFGLTHAKTDEAGGWRMTDPALYVELAPDTTHAGDTMYANLTLGDINIPASNVYGLAFTINYDPLVVDSAETKVTFGASWLGNATDKISITKDLKLNGQLKCAITRIDHANRSGFGQIGQVSFVITTDNINGKTYAYYRQNIWISDIRMIDNLGNIINVNAGSDSSYVEFEPTGIADLGLRNADLKIQPNPANDVVQISVTKEVVGGELKVLDVEGRILTKQIISTLNFELTTLNFFQGIYFIQVITEKGMLTKRLVIAR